MKRRSTRRQFLETAGSAIVLTAIPGGDRIASDEPTTSQQDPAYRSGRRSLCQQTPPPGKPLSARKSDTGIQLLDNRAGRIITYIADASKLKGGDLTLCSEYGRIEIMDSDDGEVRLQIRYNAGMSKGIEDTDVRAHLTADNGMLRVTVWQATQGFAPQYYPCGVDIRLQVPLTGPYKLDALANHGCVGVHRLTLAGCKLRGLVGTKLKGIKGYQGGHDLNDVVLSGDLDVATEAPRGFGDAWIHGTLSATASCKALARTNEGNIRLSFSPDSRTGLEVVGRSNMGKVTLLGNHEDANVTPVLQQGSEMRRKSKGYESKPIHVEVTATSALSNVTVLGFE
ncbi:MAG: hypothetical protein MOB07_02445 [Acidobacteria bacterium]|nr:hypothetical protein [Acidobacteriota bacterium]